MMSVSYRIVQNIHTRSEFLKQRSTEMPEHNYYGDLSITWWEIYMYNRWFYTLMFHADVKEVHPIVIYAKASGPLHQNQ